MKLQARREKANHWRQVFSPKWSERTINSFIASWLSLALAFVSIGFLEVFLNHTNIFILPIVLLVTLTFFCGMSFIYYALKDLQKYLDW